MRKSIELRSGSALIAMALIIGAAPVMAQGTEVEEQAPTADPDDEDSPVITVTGSRIRRTELTSPIPITTFGGEQVYQQAETNLGELLSDLPSLRQTVSQANPGLSIGVSGLNLLDLRGLGVERTLTLVNGRRHVPADISFTANAVDVNSIPAALVQEVQIVTGANSAVYGSDAIAGVVNFVLREDFEGVDLRANVGVPEVGAGTNFLLSGVAGTNFGGGRGNVTLALEYSNQERVFASDQPFRRSNDGLRQTSIDPAGQSSDGIPDRVFVRDLRSGTVSQFGLVAFPQQTARDECGGSTISGSPFNCNYVFLPNGQLVPQTFDARISNSQFGGFFGGNGDTGREGRRQSVFPQNERYVANLLANYEFSPAFEAFLEAKYVRSETLGSNSGPAFAQGRFTGAFSGDPRVRVRLDNPFLNPDARATIEQELLADGRVNDLIAGGPIDPAAVADGSQRFTVNRSFVDLGIRDEDTVRETYRVVLGARGEISSNWEYEVALNYGRTEQDINILGNVFTQRLLLALDAGIDPADGQIKCRSQFDPAAAFGQPGIDPGTLDGDIAACVPYNPFGAPDNRAAADYITADAGSFGRLEQYNALAFVSGNTADFFELPGGPVGIVVGAEYRREEAFFEADDVIEQNLTFANPLQIFEPEDPFEVIEGFAEIDVPILADRPFFEELSINAAGRVSDYRGAIGTTFAYNVGARWSPTPGLMFRGNYGQSVRAPNYTDTAGLPTVTFITVMDPCAPIRINEGTPNRAANCRADLGAILDDPNYQQVANASVSTEGANTPNPDLFEETSISYTIGAVWQPSFVPGLAITVDYYNIE
ncbi:MAG: TonB-dependent receptor, partial [Pseudomonadota bacterium]